MKKDSTAPLLDPREPSVAPAEPDVQPPDALMCAPKSDDGFTSMVERLAGNPQVDVAKLEKIIELQERILAHNARSAFDAAFARMQSEIPEVDERGQILVRGELRSTYAKLEDIHAAIKPILKAYGFAMRHRTEWPADKPNIIRIVGILSHEQGHSEESVFEAPMDKSDYRTDIQSMGSTVSYGRRYTTLDLLNIATRGEDKDGQKAEAKRPDAPAGFDDWLSDLEATADEGFAKLSDTWNRSKQEYRKYLTDHHKGKWDVLKAKATAVSAKAAKVRS